MTPLLVDILVWGVCALLIGPLVIWLLVDIMRGITSRPLKTLSQMERAFRWGSKTDSSDRRRYWATLAMRRFAEQDADPTQRERIADIMRDAITSVLHKTDNQTANDVWRMLDTLAAAKPSWEANFLEKVARSKLNGWVRGCALDHLVRLRGQAALSFLVDLMDDTAVAHSVALAILQLGKRAATPEVVVRLQAMIIDNQNGWAPSAAARALISLGQAANPVLTRHLDRFDPWTAFSVRVTTSGIDAAELIERSFVAGIIDADRRKSIKRAAVNRMRKALSVGDGFEAVTAFLQRIRAIYVFDTEWDPVPDYRALLQELARVGAPRITITDIALDMDGEACREVKCDVSGYPARFLPQFMGDWTDLAAVLKGLNAALIAAGRPERFASLYSGDQTACVIIGDEDGLTSLVETLGLPLDTDGNAAIAIGVAAENHTAARLEAAGFTVTRG